MSMFKFIRSISLKIFYRTLFTLGLVTIMGNAVTIKHTIKSGETLYTIAHENRTTIEEVRKVNGLKHGEVLKLGRVLTVPMNTYFPNKNKKIVKIAKKSKISKHKKIVRSMKKNKKINKILRIALRKHAKPLAKERSNKKGRISIGDIFFKSAQPNVMIFNNNSSAKGRNIITLAKTKLGKRYVWGAVGQKGTFDCSGLTKYVYKQNGINIPRTSFNQFKYGKYISRSQLKPGDLVFFDTSRGRKGYVNHVGIYIGNGKFLHASSAKKKVVITSLNAKFYSQRYKGARRPS